MKYSDDLLDLLNDDGDGVVEMCLIDEELKQKKEMSIRVVAVSHFYYLHHR